MKLYYTDPLKTLWMRARFQVRFTDPRGREYQDFDWEGLMEDAFNEEAWDAYSVTTPTHAHPDSYKIFEPQLGDDVRIDGFTYTVTEGNGYPDGGSVPLREVKLADHEIIRRNEKHFFMPEKED